MNRLLVLLYALPLAGAAAQTVECPSALESGSVNVRAPTGWAGGASTRQVRLVGAGMMAGSLETMTDLAPFESKTTKYRISSTWRFAAGSEKWMTCSYGSSIEISRRMDDAATFCKAEHKIDKNGNVAGATVRCSQGSGR